MLSHSHSKTASIIYIILQGALSDAGFKIGTPVATQVLDSADLLFKWCSRPEPGRLYQLLQPI